MIEYRNGDEVLFETAATVVDTGPDGITIRFGDTMLVASEETLTMVRRSVHVGDYVMHGEDRAIVAQTLEEGVHLIRVTGRSGPEAYRVVHAVQLRHAPATTPVARPAPVRGHDDQTTRNATVGTGENKVHVAAEPAEPDAVVVEQTAAPDEANVLELDNPLPPEPLTRTADEVESEADVEDVTGAAEAEEDEADDEEQAPAATRPGVAGMADALTGMITRRRNLDHLGRTDVIKPLASADDDAV